MNEPKHVRHPGNGHRPKHLPAGVALNPSTPPATDNTQGIETEGPRFAEPATTAERG